MTRLDEIKVRWYQARIDPWGRTDGAKYRNYEELLLHASDDVAYLLIEVMGIEDDPYDDKTVGSNALAAAPVTSHQRHRDLSAPHKRLMQATIAKAEQALVAYDEA